MSDSALRAFLIFESTDWRSKADMIHMFSRAALFPVFVFTLLADKLSQTPRPLFILKRLVIASFIISFTPNYYDSVAGFGLEVGDHLLKDQRIGILANWDKYIDKAERLAKKDGSSKTDFTNIVMAIYDFDSSDIIEKFSLLLIVCLLFLIKGIFSIVFYGTYSVISIFCILSIYPPFDGYLNSILKSCLYLIITPILIAFVLSFMNQHLSFIVNSEGFLDSLVDIAKFIVLCFILFATLAIGYFVVNGQGIEAWAGKMGTYMGAGLALKSIDYATGIGKTATAKTLSTGLNIGKQGSMMALAPLAHMASRPLASMVNNVSKSVKSSIEGKAQSISNHKLGGLDVKNKTNLSESLGTNTAMDGPHMRNSSNSLVNDGDNHFQSHSSLNTGANRNENLIKNRYETELSKGGKSQDGSMRIRDAINPLNHAKATVNSTTGLARDLISMSKEKVGLPHHSSNLTMREKAVFMANKAVNHRASINQKELIKGQIIANKITNSLRTKK